jgi:hypothetical protein
MQTYCKDAWSFELDGCNVDPIKLPEKPIPPPAPAPAPVPGPAPAPVQYTCSSLEVQPDYILCTVSLFT